MSYRSRLCREGSGEFGESIEPHDFNRGSGQFFPAWFRWLTPLDVLLYGAFGVGLWWLAMRLPGSNVLWFALLGGLEGVAEHVLGIYALHILEKVPWLQGVKPLEAILFSFFEYVFYWTLVAWLALALMKILQFLRA